jgi:type IV secretion system protein VirB9
LPGGKAAGARSTQRITQANAAACVQPVRSGFINAVQVSVLVGALYQVYAAPGQVTDVALQPGSNSSAGPVAAGISCAGSSATEAARASKRIHILASDAAGPRTNLVINTDRRTYLPNCVRPRGPYGLGRMDQLVRAARCGARGAAVASGVDIRHQFPNEATRRLAVHTTPSMTALRSISIPVRVRQGEMPPLFIIGPGGDSELVNYRARQNYYVVDRLFAAAELRLGDKNSERRVRIVRTDGRPRL